MKWFPTLAGRTSLTTIQGREWLPGGKFHATLDVGWRAAGCSYTEDPAAFLNGLTTADGAPVTYDHLFLTRSMPVVSGCRAIGFASAGESQIEIRKFTSTSSVTYGSDAVPALRVH